MTYFPLFMKIENREVLVCGGGAEACEKVKRLYSLRPRIRVVSENLSPEMEELNAVTIEKHRFTEKDLEPVPLFVVAAEEKAETRRIVSACRKRRIPVNAADQPDQCDFLFPALISTDQLCVGISTGGVSPTAAVVLRERIAEQIPANIDEILLGMIAARQTVQKTGLPKEMKKKLLRQIAQQAFAAGRPLTDRELKNLIACADV